MISRYSSQWRAENAAKETWKLSWTGKLRGTSVHGQVIPKDTFPTAKAAEAALDKIWKAIDKKRTEFMRLAEKAKTKQEEEKYDDLYMLMEDDLETINMHAGEPPYPVKAKG